MAHARARPAEEAAKAAAESRAAAGENIVFYDALEDEPFDDEALFGEELDEELDEDSEDSDQDRDQEQRRPSLLRPDHAFAAGLRGLKSALLGPDPSATGDWDELLRRGAEREAAGAAPELVDAGRSQRPAPAPWPETSGTFQKRSPGWVDGWRERAYVFRDRRLLYFYVERPDRPLGVLDLGVVRFELHCCWARSAAGKTEEPEEEPHRLCDACCVERTPATWRAFYLRPKAFPQKVFAFRGPSGPILELAGMIAQVLDSGLQPEPTEEQAVVSLKNFWRYPFVRERSFLSQVATGDILLFSGTDTAARLQRNITGSAYDHVALLLKTASGEVVFLEATGTHGVAVLDWRTFKDRNWHKCYTRLATRRVDFPRSLQQLQKLEDYVGSVLGNPYGLSVGKLMNRSVSAEFDLRDVKSGPGRDESEDVRTFFCSELVAACLKRAGVLAPSRPSSDYWPGSFGQNSIEPLLLQEGVHVGEEQLIVCESFRF
mmetsp:Transcript_69788/g.204649  ORF Transcript_69788/g.204649 Transcript_69788/m.204649 type:complete len:489 (-) Transcript_69788:113-1579(-)